MSFGFDIKSQKILGSVDPHEGKWSIAYEYESDDPNLISTRGRLYLVVDFEGSVGIDLHLASKILIDSIKEHYFGELEGTPLQALEAALVFGKDRLVEIINKEGVVGLNFNIASCAVWGSILYIAQVGTTSCLIIRNGEVVDISHKTSGEVMTSSGILETEDVVIIASKKFSEEFNNSELLSNLFNLETKFSQSNYAPLLSAIVIRFKKNSLPSKKDLAGIVNLIKLPKRPENKKVDVFDNSTKPTPVSAVVEEKEPKVITSLVDEGSAEGSELFPKGDEPLEHNILDNKLKHEEPVLPATTPENKAQNTSSKRGRKPKHLITGMFVFALLVSVGIVAYGFTNKKETKKAPSVSYVSTDIDKYTKIYNELGKREGSVDDYKGLLGKLKGSDVASAKGYSDLVKNIEDKISKLQESKNKDLDKYLVQDFSKKLANVSIDKVSTNGKTILVSDRTNKTSYLITEGDRENVSDLAQSSKYLSSFIEGNIMYFLDTDKVSFGTDIKTLKDLKIDKPLTASTDIFVYFENVYSLNGTSVDKLTASSTQYEYSEWKKLTNTASSIAIDGSIYIAGSNSIEKYFKGEKQNFELDKSVKLSSPIIYTDADMKNLYILSNKSLYTVEKATQKLVSTKDLSEFSNITSFTIGNSFVFITTKSALYKLPLK